MGVEKITALLCFPFWYILTSKIPCFLVHIIHNVTCNKTWEYCSSFSLPTHNTHTTHTQHTHTHNTHTQHTHNTHTYPRMYTHMHTHAPDALFFFLYILPVKYRISLFFHRSLTWKKPTPTLSISLIDLLITSGCPT